MDIKKYARSAIVHRFFSWTVIISLLLLGIPVTSYCYASDSKLEMDWDYLTHARFKDRYIDTVSLHVLEDISKKINGWSVYRGLTITRPYGHIIDGQRIKDSSAIGIGPTYMLRNEKKFSGKLYGALDVSGGLLIYDKVFPAGGRYYNFMWRIGPRFIYKCNDDSSFTIGYTEMHVSNGFDTHNPGYNGHGISAGYETRF